MTWTPCAQIGLLVVTASRESRDKRGDTPPSVPSTPIVDDSGERVLVDAMEVACSLGPALARVDSIKTLGEALSEPDSRQNCSFIRHSDESPI